MDMAYTVITTATMMCLGRDMREESASFSPREQSCGSEEISALLSYVKDIKTAWYNSA